MVNPRKHIEEIRRVKFSIGEEDNPLTEDLHNAVRHLSAELYTKDVHFLMELIQNAADNDYAADVEPSLEFVITKRDITGVGAPATLLVFNNEKGFSSKNIDSLCSVGQSTKKGKRQGGYIGEKGIGFKSVFLITTQPYIFSNGYRIRFNEVPPPDTRIGYIVPEWVDGKPYVEDIIEVYGVQCQEDLPTTVIILPLRPEKVEAVKEKLTSIHPEVILFMSKIKKLSVREEYNKERVNTVSVSKEISLGTFPDDQSESFTLHLSSEMTDDFKGECSYYMWRQKFAVKAENKIEGREDVENWVITLAFPREERRGAGIYAFLPTEMVTGLPFIIQADFLLVSSRESIKWDNKWNQGILDCIPSAFCSAFLFLVKSVGSANPFLSSSIFHKYLPIEEPSYPQLKSLRDAIQCQLKRKEIILCEGRHTYCTPLQARRILPSFRNILQKATEEGLDKPIALWSTGVSIVDKLMEKSRSLLFLGVGNVTNAWYSICIQSTPEWVKKFSEDLYVQLLCFLADNWDRELSAGLMYFPLFKYLTDGHLGRVRWLSLSEISSSKFNIYFSSKAKDIAWITTWNRELGDAPGSKFMPSFSQMAIKNLEYHQKSKLQEWLTKYPKISELSVSNFSKQLIQEAKASVNQEFVTRVAQFLHFSAANHYLNSTEMGELCSALPVVEKSGSIVRSCKVKLVPEYIGKWPKLMGMNPWAAQGFITLSSAYLNPPPCATRLIGSGQNDLKRFICDDLGAEDIPDFMPPDASFPGFSSSVAEEKVVLLLEWIQHLTVTCGLSLPMEFKRSIMQGKWLNTNQGYKSPSMSFLFDAQWKSAGLQVTDLSFINESFYKKSMIIFKSALREIGVVVDFGQGCEIVEKHLQMHTNLQAITRLYSYLHIFNWRPKNVSNSKIWIPSPVGRTGEWKDAKGCVVHDDTGLFHGRLEILENYYKTKLLPFFHKSLGVSLHPRIEDYCNLWLDWISTNHPVTETECCLVWKNILKHWKKAQGLDLGVLVKLPTYTPTGHIELCSPNEIFIPDDLFLKELFKGTRAKFAWHPKSSDPEIPLDVLFSMYNSIGAQNISQSIEKKEVSVCSDSTLHKLQAGKGLFARGLYRIVLGYLACPSFKLAVEKRHGIVRALLECSLWEATEPFRVVYTLTSMPDVKASATSLVRWEKDKKRILIETSHPQDPKSQFCLATELGEAVSKGLLWEHPDLVEGLCEMLKVGCILGFDGDVASRMLLYKNLQLFEEDESFLQQFFPRDR